MAVDPIVLALALFGRIYCGLLPDEAEAVARKTVEVAGRDADVVDLVDAFDDVWAASLTAGTISEGNTNPVHPLSMRDRMLNLASDEHEREHIMLMDDDEFPPEPSRPARYKDPKLVAVRRTRNKPRRRWDKNV
jgi:hypothetical protein